MSKRYECPPVHLLVEKVDLRHGSLGVYFVQARPSVYYHDRSLILLARMQIVRPCCR